MMEDVKHMSRPRPDDEKQKILNRLKRLEGQVRGIQTMSRKIVTALIF